MVKLCTDLGIVDVMVIDGSGDSYGGRSVIENGYWIVLNINTNVTQIKVYGS
jgi:hypothetical protein